MRLYASMQKLKLIKRERVPFIVFQLMIAIDKSTVSQIRETLSGNSKRGRGFVSFEFYLHEFVTTGKRTQDCF